MKRGMTKIFRGLLGIILLLAMIIIPVQSALAATSGPPIVVSAAVRTGVTTQSGPGQFAFISAKDGNEEVYAASSDAVYIARLTNNTFQEAWPIFSPDFSKITFTSYRDYNDEVYVMNADGSNQTRLTNNTAFDGMSNFSPNGSKITFVSNRDGNYQIYVMNADGSGQTRLTNNAASDIMPAFSPDGTKIAFASNRDSNYEIYVMNADGSNQKRLTTNAATDNYPSWISNSKLVYSTTLYGNSQIYVMNSDGTNLVRLTNNTANDDQPTWCSIAGAIFFTSWRSGNVPQVFIMTPDGVTQTQFTTDRQGNWSRADWTPPAGTAKINASVLGGHGKVSPATQTVNSGTTVTITITPNTGYHIARITDNGVSMAITNPYIINSIMVPHTIVVTFGNTYTITAATGVGGTISPTGDVAVNPGSSQTFNLKPDIGNSIATLTVDGSLVIPVVKSYTFTNVNADHTISASFTAPPAPDKWWNEVWSHRVEVTITEKSGADLTDYQIKIPVILNANMQANFGDIRFVNSDNINEIAYWMDNVISNSADFWVKVPFIPASGTVKIYMYYGNTAVTTSSNIHNTFLWGDDFQDATWTNNNIHQINYGGATQSIQNGMFRQQGSAASEPIAEIFDNGVLKTFPDNYVAEVDVNPNIKAGSAILCPRYLTVSNKYEAFLDIFWNNAALNKVVDNIWSQLSPPVKANDVVQAGTLYKLTAVISKQDNTDRLIVLIDDTNYIDQTDSPPLMNPGLALITYDLNKSFDVSYDNLRVREYSATEPTIVTGNEATHTPETKTNTVMWIVIGAAVLIAIVVVGAVIIRIRGKKK